MVVSSKQTLHSQNMQSLLSGIDVCAKNKGIENHFEG